MGGSTFYWPRAYLFIRAERQSTSSRRAFLMLCLSFLPIASLRVVLSVVFKTIAAQHLRTRGPCRSPIPTPDPWNRGVGATTSVLTSPQVILIHSQVWEQHRGRWHLVRVAVTSHLSSAQCHPTEPCLPPSTTQTCVTASKVLHGHRLPFYLPDLICFNAYCPCHSLHCGY